MSDLHEQLPQYLDELAQGTPLATLLALIPEQETEVRSLLTLAAALPTLPHPHLPATTATLAHRRLQAALAANQPAPLPTGWRRWSWRLQLFAPLTAGAALLLLVVVGLWALSARTAWLSAISGRWQTATPVTTVQPTAADLRFEPSILTFAGCDDQFLFSATLLHDAATSGHTLHDLELGYMVSQGAAYVQQVALEPTHWDELAAGDRASIAAQLQLSAAWGASADGSTVRLRLFAITPTDGVTAVPSATLDVVVRHQCAAQPAPVASPLPTPVMRPTLPNLPAQVTATENAERDFCEGDSMRHPVAAQVADHYGAPYVKVIERFCEGYGFGEIELAFELSTQSGTAVDDIFALRSAGFGWGQIMIRLGITQRTGPSSVPREQGDETP